MSEIIRYERPARTDGSVRLGLSRPFDPRRSAFDSTYVTDLYRNSGRVDAAAFMVNLLDVVEDLTDRRYEPEELLFYVNTGSSIKDGWRFSVSMRVPVDNMIRLECDLKFTGWTYSVEPGQTNWKVTIKGRPQTESRPRARPEPAPAILNRRTLDL